MKFASPPCPRRAGPAGRALAATAGEAEIRKNLAARIPQFAKIDEIRKSPMPGLYEVRINGFEIFYTDEQGNYLLQGNLIDVKARRNLTEERVEKLSEVAFDKLPMKDAFKIVRGNGKRKLAVFEDPNCGYCKQFERDLTKVDNVTIHLFLYPVLGPDSVVKSRNIWCAKDKAKAWTDWMVRGVAPEARRSCDTRRAHPQLASSASKYNITGTPTLIFSDGTRTPGADPGRAGREATRRRQLMAAPAIHFRVECADRHAHLFAITLTHRPARRAAARVAAGLDSGQLPGARVLEEPAEACARSRAGASSPREQLDKHSWQIDCAPGKPLVLRYEVCAYDNSVRTAWLDADRGFFNGTSLCLRVEGQTDAPHALEVVAPPARPAARAGRAPRR